MSDVFISYSSRDRHHSMNLAQGLRACGFSVWWDERIEPGQQIPKAIEGALEQAACIVVLWSRHSIESDWVKDEADVGRRRGILIPVSLDRATPPLSFRAIHRANLREWDGSPDNSEFVALRRAIAAIVQPNGETAWEPQPETPVSVKHSDRRICPPCPELLADAMKAGRVIPFVGAGLSRAARFPDGSHLPEYRELALHLKTSVQANMEAWPERNRPDLRAIDICLERQDYLGAIGKIARAAPKADYVRWVRRALSAVDPVPGQGHVLLNLLPFDFVITTNYDRVLEQVLDPLPEVLTYRDLAMADVLLEEADTRFILKLNGDLTRADELALGELQEKEDRARLADLMYRIFSSHKLLFLGCSFTDTEYVRLFELLKQRVTKLVGPHYALVPSRDKIPPSSRDVAESLNIHFLRYDVEVGDQEHRAVWQFLAQLKPARRFDPDPGHSTGEFFLLSEREEYLEAQRQIEESARGLRYLTPSLMNGLATPAYIERVCRPGLEQFRASLDVAFEPWADKVVRGMHRRRETIQDRVNEGCEIRILCEAAICRTEAERSLADNEVAAAIRERYHWILELLDEPSVDVEIRLTDSPFSERDVRSFASILRPHALGTDIAVAYAAQANTGALAVNLVEMNTRYAETRLTLFEKEWVRAWNEDKSEQELRRLFAPI